MKRRRGADALPTHAIGLAIRRAPSRRDRRTRSGEDLRPTIASGVEVVGPFDARGIMLLTYPYKSADKPRSEAKNDDTWVYVPNLRRVWKVRMTPKNDAPHYSHKDVYIDQQTCVPPYSFACDRKDEL